VFALIIVIISIVLAIVLSIAVVYYGGGAFSQSAAKTTALSLINQSKQIAAAGDLADARGASWPTAAPNFTQPYLTSMPVPKKDAYVTGTPSSADWAYYFPPPSTLGTKQFVISSKIRKDVCMEINRQQGFIGIPATLVRGGSIQCFGPGQEAVPVYTFYFRPIGTTPDHFDAALAKSLADAQVTIPTATLGYPRLCPDDTTITAGDCSSTTPVAPPTAEGFWVITGAITSDKSLVSDGYAATCPAGAIDPTGASASPAPSDPSELFNADGIVELGWELPPDWVAAFSGTFTRTWCIPANPADVTMTGSLSDSLSGSVDGVVQAVVPGGPGIDAEYSNSSSNKIATISANGVSWTMLVSTFYATTDNPNNGDNFDMVGRKIAIGKMSGALVSYFVNSPSLTLNGVSYTNTKGAIRFPAPPPVCVPLATSAPLGTGGRIADIKSARHYSMMLKQDGSVWMTGENYDGEFGDCTYDDSATWKRVATGVTSIWAGDHNAYIVKTDGTLWMSGDAYRNQDGLGTGGYASNKFVQIASGVTKAAGGDQWTAYLKADGTLWYAGFNTYGLVGNGTTNPVLVFTSIDSGVVSYTASNNNIMYIKSDQSLWATGSSSYYKLGDNVATGGFDSTPGAVPKKLADGVHSVSMGNENTAYVKVDGTVYATGRSSFGQFGNGSAITYTTFQQIASGLGPFTTSWTGDHMKLLKTDGTLLAAGYNVDGLFGNGTANTNNFTFSAIATGVTLFSGSTRTFYVDSSGTLWAAGDNSGGYFGDGTYSNSTVFKSVAY
jgi:alpha-tubulin suppressor-like RCC1 family protein